MATTSISILKHRPSYINIACIIDALVAISLLRIICDSAQYYIHTLQCAEMLTNNIIINSMRVDNTLMLTSASGSVVQCFVVGIFQRNIQL